MKNKTTTNLRDAIASASEIRESAIVNAKLLLEEHFAPSIKRQFELKLSENEDEDGDSFNLDEFLGEGKDKDKEDSESKEPKEPKEPKEEPKEPKEPKESKKEEEEELDLENMSEEDFIEFIRKIVKKEMSGEESEEHEMGDEEDLENIDFSGLPEDEEDGAGLDEILREFGIGDDDVDLENIDFSGLPEDEEEEELFETKAKLKSVLEGYKKLQNSLQEVNVLNAKLLYVNKIFSKNNLTESQKVAVLKKFDKATTVNEITLIHEAIDFSINKNKNKRNIAESIGFSSNAVGGVKQESPITNNLQISRMQKLAGII